MVRKSTEEAHESPIQKLRYWIFKEEIPRNCSAPLSLHEDGSDLFTAGPVPGCPLERYETYLEMLCGRVSTFSAKDYFESSTHRYDSHKFVNLPNGKVLYATLRTEGPYRQNASLHLHVNSSEDYFQLHQIDSHIRPKLAKHKET